MDWVIGLDINTNPFIHLIDWHFLDKLPYPMHWVSFLDDRNLWTGGPIISSHPTFGKNQTAQPDAASARQAVSQGR